jgi:hypothetical protein
MEKKSPIKPVSSTILSMNTNYPNAQINFIKSTFEFLALLTILDIIFYIYDARRNYTPRLHLFPVAYFIFSLLTLHTCVKWKPLKLRKPILFLHL